MSEKKTEDTPHGLSDADIMAAMREIEGYIDITPTDFREIYLSAYHHALKRLTQNIRVKDIMVRNPHVITTHMNLLQAAQLFSEKNISGAPVVDTCQRIVGILSEKDFLSVMGMNPEKSFMQVVATCLANRGCLTTDIRHVSITDIMSQPPVTAGPDTPLYAISRLFQKNSINRIPIIDTTDRVIGIVTRSDLSNVFATFHRTEDTL